MAWPFSFAFPHPNIMSHYLLNGFPTLWTPWKKKLKLTPSGKNWID